MIPVDRPAGRARLRQLLRARYAWLDDVDVGPRAVEAGECDRCGTEARLVNLCGPVPWAAVGRRCAAELGPSGWCEGHAADARSWLDRLAALPAEADTVTRLWWVATGEVRPVGLSDAGRRMLGALDAGEALPSPWPDEPGDPPGQGRTPSET